MENILKNILLSHKAEVVDLVLTEFNKELYEQGLKEDTREEGLAEKSHLLYHKVNVFG